MSLRSGRQAGRFRPGEWLDVRSGLAGGLVLGAAVWLINVSHGYWGASTAALKQFVYTFFMGAAIMRLCTALAQRPGPDVAALWLALAVPSAVTIGATFFVHSLRGTPEPVLSTLPVAIVSPIAFGLWARRVRRDGRTPWDRLRSRSAHSGQETDPPDAWPGVSPLRPVGLRATRGRAPLVAPGGVRPPGSLPYSAVCPTRRPVARSPPSWRR
jgi:hypothetical protein